MSNPANWDPDVSAQLALGVGAGSVASGDVGGSLPGPTVVQAIQGTPVAPTAPAPNQTLIYDPTSGEWTPQGMIVILTLEAGDFVNPVAPGLGTWKASPLAGTIVGAYLEADPAGSVTANVVSANSAVPTNDTTGLRCGSTPPALSSAAFGWFPADATWTSAVAIHDVFRLVVVAVSGGVTRVTLQLVIRQ
jgi:hypothetical protein